MLESASLPSFLRAIEDFLQHVEEHFDGLKSTERGEAFLQFILKALRFVDDVASYSHYRANPKKSHDGGVDFFGRGSGPELIGQSKYKLPKADEFDKVISGFQSYEQSRYPKGQIAIAGVLPPESPPAAVTYCICTNSKLDNIVASYRKRNLSSKPFFEQLEREHRIIIIDGPKLFAGLRRAFQQSFVPPAMIDLTLDTEYIEHGTVFLTVVGAEHLVKLFDQYGPSLFFENIREFLGFTEDRNDRTNVNHEIRATLERDPQKMLERNNGIVLRASRVEKLSERVLRLHDPGIVNGCQTTMCVVATRDAAVKASVFAKIVVSNDAWEIAKAANHQNIIYRVDLELARFIRPQVVRKVALEAGFSVEAEDESISAALDQIYQRKASQEELRHVALGVFSRKVSNLFSPRYEGVRLDVLNRIEDSSKAERILSVLLQLMNRGRIALASAKLPDESAALFKRFFEKPAYRAFVAILAASGIVEEFTELDDLPTDDAYSSLCSMIDILDRELTENGNIFDSVCHKALSVSLSHLFKQQGENESEEKLTQLMQRYMASANFSVLRRELRIRLSLEGAA